MNKKQDRSLILEIEELKVEIAGGINAVLARHNVPFYFIEPIINQLLIDVKEQAQREITTLRQMEREMAERGEKEPSENDKAPKKGG